MRDRIDRQAALSFQLAARFRERIYVFKAERPNIGDGSIATEHRLAANASNLAQVLNRLQTQNPNAFDRLVICLKQVFPDIKAVTVPPIGQSSVRVLVWSIDLATERDDLAVSLSESGTGVGQILAMLYVVLTTRHPQTIVIDEPSSFLHPGAVRTLLEILSTYPQHQYILTTHSPVALSAAKPGALVLFTRNNLETQVRQMNPTEATELASVLAEVGARLSDVFGADRVLWVEGPTEEECFSVIRARCRDALEPAIQTIIVGLRRVGELEGRDAERVVAIYERLVQAPALMPASVGFLFDREGRTSKQREDLARRLGGRVGFLERRMFENYLLQPDAIAAVTSGIQGFREAQVTEDEVESWLRTNMWDGKYWPDGLPEKRTEEIWIRDVHAAKMLATLFKRLSETRVLYEKVKHGVLLTQWICEHRPAAFSELVATIRQALRDQPDESKI